ncbi:MAG: hypothetical protein ACYTG1_05260 [Planctomycetota bacterium]|jgi:hypothetical protein
MARPAYTVTLAAVSVAAAAILPATAPAPPGPSGDRAPVRALQPAKADRGAPAPVPKKPAPPARTLREEAQRLAPQLIDQCLAVAEDLDPATAQRLRALCDEDQEAFERIMRVRGRRLLGLAQLRERDPKLYQAKLGELRISMQVTRMARQVREAQRLGSEVKAEELESQLRGLIRIQVALSLKARGDYIRRLEEHIEALRAQLEADARQFDETVEKRLEQVMQGGAPDDLFGADLVDS